MIYLIRKVYGCKDTTFCVKIKKKNKEKLTPLTFLHFRPVSAPPRPQNIRRHRGTYLITLVFAAYSAWAFFSWARKAALPCRMQ